MCACSEVPAACMDCRCNVFVRYAQIVCGLPEACLYEVPTACLGNTSCVFEAYPQAACRLPLAYLEGTIILFEDNHNELERVQTVCWEGARSPFRSIHSVFGFEGRCSLLKVTCEVFGGLP